MNNINQDNLYDVVYWPNTGVFDVKELRINSNRQIYDVPHQEMKLLVKELNCSGEELHRKILDYFGYEVLTGIDYYNNGFAIEREPFENDVVDVSNPMRVGRGDTPDDPSVPAPIGNGVLPMLIFVILWVIYKKS